MKVRHLEYFAEIVNNGSINGAAKNLFISPQALSAVVANLESELGYPLLVRNRQGVTPTAEGQIIYDDLKKILPVIGQWNKLGNTEQTSYLEVYVSLALAAAMNRVIIDLEESMPNCSILLREARGKKIIETALKKEKLIAVIALTDKIRDEFADKLKSCRLELIKLRDDRFAAIVGKEYRPEITGELTKADYASIDYIFSGNQNDIIGKKYVNEFGHHLNSKVESHSSILCMAALNKGAVMLPSLAVKCEPLYISGMLRSLPVSGDDNITRHYLLIPHDELLNADERRLKEAICRSYLKDIS